MQAYSSYQALVKPLWSPPVWTVLYAIIALTYGTVFYKAFTREVPWLVALPFALNLVFNFSFTYLQFGLRNNYLATLDILLVLATLVWAMVAIWPHMRWITLANIPYLAWVAFATVLQLTVTYLNRG